MPQLSSIHLSVIIPAYNEEKRLPATLDNAMEYLSAQSYGAEIVVVDDGSTDGTVQVIRHLQASNDQIRLVTQPKNRGKGAAVRLGMMEASGDYRIFMDADNSTTLDQIGSFWPWIEQGYDVVIGSRGIEGSEIAVRQPRYKELAGRFGNLIIRALVIPGIYDTQAGFKLFSRRSAGSIFPRVTLERWGYDIEVLAIAGIHGYRIREIPIRWANSPGSKVKLRSYFDVFYDVWRIRNNLKTGVYL
jgi:glycosyltransferase involved in cell wall biosynthesis